MKDTGTTLAAQQASEYIFSRIKSTSSCRMFDRYPCYRTLHPLIRRGRSGFDTEVEMDWYFSAAQRRADDPKLIRSHVDWTG